MSRRNALIFMSRKLILLLLIIIGGLGCWAFYQKIYSAATPSLATVNKPSPGIARTVATQPSAVISQTTAPATTPLATDVAATDAASSETEAASSLIGMRLDDTRVYVALRSDGIDFENEGAGLTTLGKGAKFGPGAVFQASDEVLNKYQKFFKRVQIGEEWELELAPDSRVHANVTAPVVVETGC